MPSRPESNALTRTERQRLRTRRSLLDAGRKLIASKGVAGLRIQEITAQADVALGSFYNYFASKTELLEAIITETLSDLASAVITNLEDEADPAEVVALASLRIIRLAYDEPDFASLIVNIGHSGSLFGDAVHPHARIAVERGIESGRFIVADIEVLLTVVIGGAFALIREILDGRRAGHAQRVFARYVLSALGLPLEEAEALVERVAQFDTGFDPPPAA